MRGDTVPRLREGQPPSYRKHKASGQAIVSLPRGDGTYQDVLLGKFGTKASRFEYARHLKEWEANGRRAPQPAAADLEVNELVNRFWQARVENRYRDADGNPTSEVGCYRAAFRPLLQLYRYLQAADFGPLALEAVRKLMTEDGMARNVVNGHVSRIRRCFAWGVSKQLLPASTVHALQTVEGLRRGDGRDTKPIGPVSEAAVDATLPFLGPTVQAMVELQLVTGMRPGEVCTVRPCDLDVSGAVWLYRPARHKTQHLGQDRGRLKHIKEKGDEVAAATIPGLRFPTSPRTSTIIGARLTTARPPGNGPGAAPSAWLYSITGRPSRVAPLPPGTPPLSLGQEKVFTATTAGASLTPL
jgi:integrase